MNKLQNTCTCEGAGKVLSIKAMGQDHRTMIVVKYTVNGKDYTVEESLKLKSQAIKLGFIPIGQKRVPVMGDTSVGSTAYVMYNPKNPGEAFLRDNVGKQNI